MTFKKGESGNSLGRPKGIPNKRSQLAKLFEPHAEGLIAKAVELALSGDVQALRLCLERLVPKADHIPFDLELPNQINSDNLPEVKNMILSSVFDGELRVDDAGKLISLITHQVEANPALIPVPVLPIDPVEASKVYQRFMRDS